MPALYQAMDIFILPSHFEGLCVAAVEAQASGLMCFCSDALSEETTLVRDRFFRIPLIDSVSDWSQFMLHNLPYKRKNEERAMQDAGYDIDTEIEKIQSYYMSAAR